jgi:acyl-CoA dehydrogenase
MDRVATCASLIGTGKVALFQASEYAKKRIVFHKQIGAYQGIQFPLADSMARLLSAEVMTLKAASFRDNGGNYVNEANYALYESVEAASAATDAALQAFGGHGYAKDYDVERYWRDVRAHRVHPLSTELLLASIAQRSLDLPKSY